MLKEIKVGTRVRITDIGTTSAYYPERSEIIGQIGTVTETLCPSVTTNCKSYYGAVNIPYCYGFYSCDFNVKVLKTKLPWYKRI